MMSFTMIKKTLTSVAAASSTLFSRIGKLRVAHPAKVDDVLPTPEPASYVVIFSPLVLALLFARVPQCLTLSLRSPILPSISTSFSWSAVLTDSTKSAAAVECTVPSLIITSPSTATVEAADESEPNPFHLRPDGDFLTSQELRELADIDFDDDGSQPPMILASALPLLSLAAIAEQNETAATTAFVEPEHKQRLTTIAEADECSDAPESDISRFASLSTAVLHGC
jgi:hypothetical protein